MAASDSIRSIHSDLAILCESLESLFRLSANDSPDLCSAAHPAIDRFRFLLDSSDSIISSIEDV